MTIPTLNFDERVISFHQPNGKIETIEWAELIAVLIETNSKGPFSTDLFWLLVGKDKGCVIPAEVEGERLFFERLQELPGFDNEAVIEAMSCVEDKRFLCWKR